MTFQTLVQITNGTYVGKKKKFSIKNFSIDTRTLQKGDIYIALQGKTKDGSLFIEEAFQKGALFCIAQKPVKHRNILVVKDPLDALWKIASYIRSQYQIPVIAVTGSVGKSTFKEILSTILEPDYLVLKSEASKNNHIGVPLTLLNLSSTIDLVISEVGMNHKGEIKNLCQLLKPNIGVFTKIGTSHIGNLGSKKEILKAKCEMIEEVQMAFGNGYDPSLNHLKLEIPYFKTKKEMKIKNIKVGHGITSFRITYKKKDYFVSFPYEGYHYPELIALALLVSQVFQVSIQKGIERLQHVTLLNGRMEHIPLNHHILLIDDSYNASYESFLEALKKIKKEKKNKLLILGDMLELGTYSKKYHKKLIRKINRIKHCEVWYTGDTFASFRHFFHHGTYFPSIHDMKSCIEENNWENAVILLKGAHAFHLENVRNWILEKYKRIT